MTRGRSGVWLLAALAAVTIGSSRAQQPRDDAPFVTAPPPRYRVEFILFAHAEFDPGEETFAAPDPAIPLAADPPPVTSDDAARPESSPDDQAPAPDTGPFDFIDPFGRLAGADDGRPPFRFRILETEELELADEYSRIDGLSAYRVLARGGWEQDGLDEAQAQPMNLANLGVTNPQGTLRLHLSRFLHLSIDLEYQAPDTASGPAAIADPQALAELARRPEFRMVEQRRIARSGELHYVDHPLFGLLFRVSPAPTDADEGVEDDTGNLAPAA